MSMSECRREQNKLAQRRFRQRYRENGNASSASCSHHSQVPLPSIETIPLSRSQPPSIVSTEIHTPNGNSVQVFAPASSSASTTFASTSSIASTASTTSNTTITEMLTPMSSSSHPPSTKSSIPPRYCSHPLLSCLRMIDSSDINNMNNTDSARSPLELDSTTTASLSSMLAEQPFLHNNIPEITPYSPPQTFMETSRGGDNQGANTGWASSLHIAAQKGYDRIMRILLQHSNESNINVPDSQGQTPLICATIGGHKDVVALLLGGGAAVSCVDHAHRSALHWAVVHRRELVLKLLLSHGQGEEETLVRTVIDGYDLNGQTPLHLATDEAFEDGVRLLLEYGANMNLVAQRPSLVP